MASRSSSADLGAEPSPTVPGLIGDIVLDRVRMVSLHPMTIFLVLATSGCERRRAQSSAPASSTTRAVSDGGTPPTVATPVIAALDAPPAPAAAIEIPAAVHYATYANEHFGYRVDYPTFLHAGSESDMGDGVVFRMGDRVALRVSGAANASMSTTEERMSEADTRRRVNGWRVTMRRRTHAGYVLSGLRPERIFYEYVVVSDDAITTVDFEYDDALRGAMDPVIANVVHSIVPTHIGAPTGEDATPDSSTTESASTCSTAQLRIEFGEGDAASGHRSVPLIFRNTGATPCRLSGSPTVVAIDRRGAVIESARATDSGHFAAASDAATDAVIDLGPGRVASALVESSAARDDGRSCTPYAAVRVTLGNGSTPARVVWRGDGCSGLEVHGFVPGETGQSP